MFKLFKMKSVPNPMYIPIPFGTVRIPRSNRVIDREVKPTGRWKIKAVEGKEPVLYLEGSYHANFPFPRWIHEGRLEIMEVTEYINTCECSK